MLNLLEDTRAMACRSCDFGREQPAQPAAGPLHGGRASQSHLRNWSTRRRASCLLVAAAIMSVAGLVRLVDAENPLAAAEAIRFIRQSGDRLVAIVTGPGSLPEKRRLMYLLVSERVDVYGIARFALGRFWNAATDRQRDKYVRVFPAILVAEIGLTRADYRVMSFSIDRCTQLDDEFQVWTTVLLPGIPPMHVGWSVGRIGGTAKIVDVIADNASLRITQRDQCASFLAHNNYNIEALIAMLQQQAEATS